MKVKEGFIRQRIGDTEVVVAVGKKSAEFKSVITLNGSGAFLWTLLENGTDEEKMLAAMLEKYDVPEEIAKRDISLFLNKARSAGVIE